MKKPYKQFVPEDVETGQRGDQELVGLDNFTSRLQRLTGNVKEIERLVGELDTQHTAGLDCVGEQEKAEHNERLKNFTNEIHARAAAAQREHKELQSQLDRELRGAHPNDYSRKISLQNSMDMLLRALQTSVSKLQQFQNRCKLEEKQMVQEQLHDVLGRAPQDDEVDRVLAAGDKQTILATMMRDRGTTALQGVLQQMEARLHGTQAIEREVTEIVELLQQVAAQVSAQKEQVRKIQDEVQSAADHVVTGVSTLGAATDYKKRAMQIKWGIISVVLFTILAVIAIALIVTLGQK